MPRSSLELALVCLIVAGLAVILPAVGGAAPPPSPAATSFTLTLVSSRATAQVNETIIFSLFLNVSGGVLQLSRVNFSLEPDLEAPMVGMTTPPECGVTASNATFVEWRCSFLQVGQTYQWSIPVNVSANATKGQYRGATAEAVELGGPATPRVSQVSVWILSTVLEVTIFSNPQAAALPKDVIAFFVNVTNILDANDTANETLFTAWNVTLIVSLSPYLDVGNSTLLVKQAATLSPNSSLSLNLLAIVNENAAMPGQVWINATLTYHDVTNHSFGPETIRRVLQIFAVNPLPATPASAIIVIVFALIAILAAVVIAPVVGERNLAIDEVFLVHRSGILIQHLTRGPGLRKDDDLVASMFVAIQEFVRDSFHTMATLDELAFAGRKAAVLRGDHVVLAALLSRGSPRYLFPQMKAVEREIEGAHGAALVDWDGRVSRLDRVEPILQRFLSGDYRRVRGWWG